MSDHLLEKGDVTRGADSLDGVGRRRPHVFVFSPQRFLQPRHVTLGGEATREARSVAVHLSLILV